MVQDPELMRFGVLEMQLVRPLVVAPELGFEFLRTINLRDELQLTIDEVHSALFETWLVVFEA